MSFSEAPVAIRVSNLSKTYQVYEKPIDRLKQAVVPRLKRALGLSSRDYFCNFRSLDSVSFEIRKGETVGIIGRNGAGKSTLLQIICGTLAATNGSVEVNGRVAALLELGAGFNPEFTGRENVYMSASILGLSDEEIDKRYESIVDFAGIGDYLEQPVKTYSSGMYVRLAFAVIAHVDADILVIDEALAVGDAFFTQKCMRFLRTFMSHGTVLFVSHDIGAIQSLCDSAILLEGGRLKMQSSAKSVAELYMRAIYAESQDVEGAQENASINIGHKEDILSDSPGGIAEGLVAFERDCRDELINSSNLRNHLEVFQFGVGGEQVQEFGTGHCKIVNASLINSSGDSLLWLSGGEKVLLQIDVQVFADLDSPIVGFSFKDHRGQVLFGDNTYMSYANSPCAVAGDQSLRVSFEFTVPRLPVGDYAIDVAIADGTRENHIQHHWLHEALIVKSMTSSIVEGLVGLPMSSIQMSVSESSH